MIQQVLFIFLLSGPIFSWSQDAPVVNTPLGSIKGKTGSSSKGINYYSFQAIRYAEAPNGDLRFRVSAKVFFAVSVCGHY